MDMLGLKKAAEKLARANGVRWYGYVLIRPEEDVLMKAMVHEVDGNVNSTLVCREAMPLRHQKFCLA